MGRHSLAPSSERNSTSQPSPQRSARHRGASGSFRRGVARWPIALLAIVVLGAAGWFGWAWANGEVNQRANAAAADCQEGPAALRVAVTPEAERTATAAAKVWNQQRTVVQAHCVQVNIAAIPEKTVRTALENGWDSADLGERPQAWIADQGSITADFVDRRPELAGSTPEQLAGGDGAQYSYVALAGDEVSAVQARAAQQFLSFAQGR
ncbi:hypothetical protein EV191_10799 [Tamaricihabitans halophyticus]|uniref:Extracellular solute-binding protein n=1 Tax=Tamaricihabitans halophyticus TaxID=1262583 RepID=A0A4R2QUS1_9PSEU|nr:hypothetical protein [Tamaricihabitans halophyticus]TCP50835.1 hypothetical protein EV191_10799 [Tamaricihabitans halophyticus]